MRTHTYREYIRICVHIYVHIYIYVGVTPRELHAPRDRKALRDTATLTFDHETFSNIHLGGMP